MPKLVEDFLEQYLANLRVPQIRALLVLRGEGRGIPLALSRAKLQERCGFTPTSGTVTRVMRGLPGGTSSGPACPGLIELGLVRVLNLEVDGVTEQCYQITPMGQGVIDCHTGDLPPLRSVNGSTNSRYKKVLTRLDSDQSEIYGQVRKEEYAI